MQHNSTRRQSLKQSPKPSPKRSRKSRAGPITIGVDLGGKASRQCLLNDRGEVVQEASAATPRKGLGKCSRRCCAAGSRSRWALIRRG